MDNLKDIIKRSQMTIRGINKVSMDKSISYEKGCQLREERNKAKNRIFFAKQLMRAMQK